MNSAVSSIAVRSAAKLCQTLCQNRASAVPLPASFADLSGIHAEDLADANPYRRSDLSDDHFAVVVDGFLSLFVSDLTIKAPVGQTAH